MAEKQQNISKVPPQLRDHVFRPGQSGNPKGRPRGNTITERLRKVVEQDDDGRIADELVKAATEAAKAGDFRFWNAIVERLDGKVSDKRQDDDSDSQLDDGSSTPAVDAVTFPLGAIPAVPRPEAVSGGSSGAQVGEDGASETEAGGVRDSGDEAQPPVA